MAWEERDVLFMTSSTSLRGLGFKLPPVVFGWLGWLAHLLFQPLYVLTVSRPILKWFIPVFGEQAFKSVIAPSYRMERKRPSRGG
jgi:hypothetical protein